MFEKYEHHGTEVHVKSELKGKHRDHCLCYSCTKFKPNEPGQKNRIDNCYIANRVFNLCTLFDLVLPVWECPNFEEKKETEK